MEYGPQRVDGYALEPRLRQVEITWRVAAQRDQMPRDRDLPGKRFDPLAHLRCEFVRVFEDCGGRSVLLDQLGGGLRSHALDAGDVVHAVPGQRLNLDGLFGRI